MKYAFIHSKVKVQMCSVISKYHSHSMYTYTQTSNYVIPLNMYHAFCAFHLQVQAKMQNLRVGGGPGMAPQQQQQQPPQQQQQQQQPGGWGITSNPVQPGIQQGGFAAPPMGSAGGMGWGGGGMSSGQTLSTQLWKWWPWDQPDLDRNCRILKCINDISYSHNVVAHNTYQR